MASIDDIVARVVSAREALARDFGNVARLRRAAEHPDAPETLRAVAQLVAEGVVEWEQALDPRSDVREISRLYAGRSQRALRPILDQLDAEDQDRQVEDEPGPAADGPSRRGPALAEADYADVDSVFETREEAERRVGWQNKSDEGH